MNYYKRHLGDYAKKAGRLSMLQHGAYTLLIDACYDRERFPTRDEAIEWTWASTPEETSAVEFVLNKFFVLEDGLYVQKRIKDEIDAYKETCAINSKISKGRPRSDHGTFTKRPQSVDGNPTQSPQQRHDETTTIHLTTNQEPLTKNQEPRTKLNPPTPSGLEGRFEIFWETYPKKKSKGDALKAFKAIKPDEQLVATMVATIERATKSEQWLKNGGQFIPFPATWLRARGWEDEDTASVDPFAQFLANAQKAKEAASVG